jgi:hypothetical protein
MSNEFFTFDVSRLTISPGSETVRDSRKIINNQYSIINNHGRFFRKNSG